ncbi:MAG: SDR family oxidoreductase [Anaerolineaceae bacterium]|nr:SDR family oxidoreductase [Anaerolineaceae bacterium]
MSGSVSMKDKIVLVTGATDGIGKVTAETLAGLGARVVLVGRNLEKTELVVNEIIQKTGNSGLEYLIADLSIQSQVRRLAQEFRQIHNRLDVLVNNAGAMFMSRQQSQDGYEMTFALNHLAYFLLTNLLLDVIKTSGPARIVNVSSAAHQGAQLNFDDLQNRKHYNSQSVYAQSKLANLYFTYELSRRLAGIDVTVNALHPGFVATNFGANNGGIYRLAFGISHVGAISPAEGAETTIYLASSPDVAGVTGKYFIRKKETRSSEISYDEQAAARLWQISLELTGLTEHEMS